MSSPAIHIAPLQSLTVRFRVTSEPNSTIDTTPIIIKRSVVDLRLVRKDGKPPETIQFRVDTGADITQISYEKARFHWGLQISGKRGQIKTITAAGERWVWAYRGNIRVMFRDSDEPILLTCLFVEDWPVETPPLLGIHDTLESVQFRFDKTISPTAPYGVTVFECYHPQPIP
jgi:hypothetical protein